jgi:hypothetical protein
MRRTRSNGFSLIESVVIIIVLAMAVPPSLQLLDSAAASRADSINTTRATLLGMSVMEHILADVYSSDPALGFDALADSEAYLNTAGTGLVDRLASVADVYAALGISFSVEIGPLAQADGTTSGDPDLDVYREITVVISYPSATEGVLDMPISAIVSEISP